MKKTTQIYLHAWNLTTLRPYFKKHQRSGITVRETGVSRHHGCPIEGSPPWKPSVQHSTIVLRDFRRALNWASIIPRDGSLLNSQSNFVSPGEMKSFTEKSTVYATHISVCLWRNIINKYIHWLPESLMPFCIIGAHVRDHLKPIGTALLLWCLRCFRGSN